MLFALAVILFVAWLLGLVAFHVTAGFIHIVLVAAVVLFILGFFRRGRTV
jgi:hypothetical protein